MWFAERRLLYKMLREHRPRLCVEIGTATGGGSTFFTALALEENGDGMLHTYEVDACLHNETRAFYAARLPALASRVSFHLADYRTFAENALVDCLMLDGPEDAQSTLEQLEFFEPKLSPGALVFAHDWNTEKARLVRPLLEQGGRYRIAARLDAPVSVGFVAAFRAAS
jgi:predicted O-methyltransferase YrrM